MAQFTNKATLLYNGNQNSSNTVTGELTEVLSLNVNALNGCYTKDDTLTYIVSIGNTGSVPYTGLTVSDHLGAYLFGAQTLYPLTYSPNSLRYYQNGILQDTPTVVSGAPLTVSGITVPANGIATLLYTARVNEFAPLDTGSSITSTVTLSGADTLTVSTAVGACTRANLSIAKFMTPETVSENGQLTYTFLIQNLGNTAADAADLVQISDQFNPILSDLNVTLNGTALQTPADYTYSADGLFETVPGKVTVPAAVFSQDPNTGAQIITPGTATLIIRGTV